MKIVADGGTGKTVLSMQLLLRWAKGQFNRFNFVFRVDIKTINGPTKEDLLEAILKTIPDATMTVTEMDNLIRQNQEKCLLILDGLDEAGRDSREAVNILFAGDMYLKTTVVLLFRPEAIGSLKAKGMSVMEFTIDPFTMNQVRHFIQHQYPFATPERRETMLQECMSSKKLKELVPLPIYLIMLSGLYDDPTMYSYIKEGADIYLSALAMMIKTEVLKHGSLSPTEEDELSEMSVEEIINRYGNEIASFGFAIFRCNGNTTDRYEDLPRKELRAHMIEFLNNDDKRIDSFLRLGLCDTICIIPIHGIEKYLRFFHRNFRDMVVAFGIKAMVHHETIKGKKYQQVE
jgi:hypothetical protein